MDKILNEILLRTVTFLIGVVLVPLCLVMLAVAILFVVLIPILAIVGPDTMKIGNKTVREVMGL